jgi:hypothetical protein
MEIKTKINKAKRILKYDDHIIKIAKETRESEKIKPTEAKILEKKY